MSAAAPLVCAHRGARAYHPDNSHAGFLAAIAMGADMIETDVRRAGDGRLLLAHDPIGAAPPQDAVELGELVALAAGRVALDVELKEAGCEEEVLAALDPRPEGLIVTSFLPAAIRALRAVDAGLRTGLILPPGDRRGDVLARAAACGADAVVAHVSLLDDELGRRATEERRPLMVWTVNAPARLARVMRTPGVTHVVTDAPDVAVRVRAGLG
jgi:glycerophosphoryl diester phosphodiesterase